MITFDKILTSEPDKTIEDAKKNQTIYEIFLDICNISKNNTLDGRLRAALFSYVQYMRENEKDYLYIDIGEFLFQWIKENNHLNQFILDLSPLFLDFIKWWESPNKHHKIFLINHISIPSKTQFYHSHTHHMIIGFIISFIKENKGVVSGQNDDIYSVKQEIYSKFKSFECCANVIVNQCFEEIFEGLEYPGSCSSVILTAILGSNLMKNIGPPEKAKILKYIQTFHFDNLFTLFQGWFLVCLDMDTDHWSFNRDVIVTCLEKAVHFPVSSNVAKIFVHLDFLSLDYWKEIPNQTASVHDFQRYFLILKILNYLDSTDRYFIENVEQIGDIVIQALNNIHRILQQPNQLGADSDIKCYLGIFELILTHCIAFLELSKTFYYQFIDFLFKLFFPTNNLSTTTINTILSIIYKMKVVVHKDNNLLKRVRDNQKDSSIQLHSHLDSLVNLLHNKLDTILKFSEIRAEVFLCLLNQLSHIVIIESINQQLVNTYCIKIFQHISSNTLYSHNMTKFILLETIVHFIISPRTSNDDLDRFNRAICKVLEFPMKSISIRYHTHSYSIMESLIELYDRLRISFQQQSTHPLFHIIFKLVLHCFHSNDCLILDSSISSLYKILTSYKDEISKVPDLDSQLGDPLENNKILLPILFSTNNHQPDIPLQLMEVILSHLQHKTVLLSKILSYRPSDPKSIIISKDYLKFFPNGIESLRFIQSINNIFSTQHIPLCIQPKLQNYLSSIPTWLDASFSLVKTQEIIDTLTILFKSTGYIFLNGIDEYLDIINSRYTSIDNTGSIIKLILELNKLFGNMDSLKKIYDFVIDKVIKGCDKSNLLVLLLDYIPQDSCQNQLFQNILISTLTLTNRFPKQKIYQILVRSYQLFKDKCLESNIFKCLVSNLSFQLKMMLYQEYNDIKELALNSITSIPTSDTIPDYIFKKILFYTSTDSKDIILYSLVSWRFFKIVSEILKFKEPIYSYTRVDIYSQYSLLKPGHMHSISIDESNLVNCKYLSFHDYYTTSYFCHLKKMNNLTSMGLLVTYGLANLPWSYWNYMFTDLKNLSSLTIGALDNTKRNLNYFEPLLNGILSLKSTSLENITISFPTQCCDQIHSFYLGLNEKFPQIQFYFSITLGRIVTNIGNEKEKLFYKNFKELIVPGLHRKLENKFDFIQKLANLQSITVDAIFNSKVLTILSTIISESKALTSLSITTIPTNDFLLDAISQNKSLKRIEVVAAPVLYPGKEPPSIPTFIKNVMLAVNKNPSIDYVTFETQDPYTYPPIKEWDFLDELNLNFQPLDRELNFNTLIRKINK